MRNPNKNAADGWTSAAAIQRPRERKVAMPNDYTGRTKSRRHFTYRGKTIGILEGDIKK